MGDIGFRLRKRLGQELQPAAAADIGQLRAEATTLFADAVARHASHRLKQQPARGGIARRFFQQALRAQPFDEPDHLPHFVVGHAHGRHVRPRDAKADRRVQLRIPAAAPVEAGREIGAATALTIRAVANRAMFLKEGRSLLDVGVRRKRIRLRDGSRGGWAASQRSVLGRLRPQIGGEGSYAATDPKNMAHRTLRWVS